MLDTATGKVWSYIPSGPFTTQSGKPGFTPEMFGRVFIDELEGSIPDQLQKATEYFEKHPAIPFCPSTDAPKKHSRVLFVTSFIVVPT
jgi:hypothetical protein